MCVNINIIKTKGIYLEININDLFSKFQIPEKKGTPK